LCGYGAGPALSQDRLSALPDGRLAIRMKRPLADGRQELLLEPVELLRRLATLVPPPRAHITRFHGAFGPASKWRGEIVPAAPIESPDNHQCAASAAAAPAGPDGTAQLSPLAEPTKPRRPASKIRWAELLQRVFKVSCGSAARAIAPTGGSGCPTRLVAAQLWLGQVFLSCFLRVRFPPSLRNSNVSRCSSLNWRVA
jgi:hypothetical protein